MSKYLHIPADKPGVPLESEMSNDMDVVVNEVRINSEQAQDALTNDSLYQFQHTENA